MAYTEVEGAMKRATELCLVMCSAEKAPNASRAANLYRSPRFVADREAAESSFPVWRIFSGRHGLVLPSEVIGPYEADVATRPAGMRLLWMARLGVQLVSLVGFWTPAAVTVLGRGFYLAGAGKALEVIGFRCRGSAAAPLQGMVWIRNARPGG